MIASTGGDKFVLERDRKGTNGFQHGKGHPGDGDREFPKSHGSRAEDIKADFPR